MKPVLALFLMIAWSFHPALGQATLEWVQTAGGISTDIGWDVAVDASGNVITVGQFRETVDMDPGSGTTNLTAVDHYDGFIQKLDINGNFLWAYAFGGSSGSVDEDAIYAVDLDEEGNIYMTGFYQGTADMDPGSGTATLSGGGDEDLFVVKLDSNGNFLWAYGTTGGAGDEQGRDIAVGGDGVYVTGYFSSTVDFDPSSSTTTLTSAGSNDIFVLKLDRDDGSLTWAQSFGSSATADRGYGIALDSNNNVYLTGTFADTVDFDYSTGVFSLSSSGSTNLDMYALKLDSNGAFQWAKSWGSSGHDYGYGIDVNNKGDLFLIGTFNDSIDADPGSGVDMVVSNGSLDYFVGKLDYDGNYQWGQSFGGSSTDYGYALDANESGYVVLSGYFYDSLDFDPGPGVHMESSAGFSDGFLHVLDGDGNFVSVSVLSGTLFDWMFGCRLDESANLYGTGLFYAPADLSTDTGLVTLTGTASDIITVKYSQCFPSFTTDVQSSCSGSYTWIDGNTYTASNDTATHILTNAAGCDSIITLNLTIGSTTTATDVVTACDSHTWIDGNTYSASNNTAMDTLVNAAGCDSVVTLNLTILNSTTATDVLTACDSYTWIDGNTYSVSNNSATHVLTNTAGCDSTVTLNLTILNSTTGTDAVSACDSYTWIDGNTYTASNSTATHVLTNTAGCDSTVTLNLTILNSTTGTEVITACDSYTWIDGNTYTASNSTATHVLTNSAGCDSTVTLNLTILNSTTGTDVITACDSYTWIDGNTYSASNSTATHVLTNSAGCDSTVTLNLTILNSTTGTDAVSACDSYTWIDGNTYTASNSTATHVLTNTAGCDSTVTLNLTILNSTTGTDVITACDSYTWIDGNTYTSSNNSATHVLTNTAGCDSTVTLNLTILNSTAATDVVEACDSYTWMDGNTYTTSNNTATHTLVNSVGCDSIVTLNLTILNSTFATDVVEACDSYTWINGVTYTESNNTAVDTLVNAAGCDSIVVLDLTITIVDTTVTLDGFTLTSNDMDATYQWIDCSTMTLIDGETSASFTATANGQYAVEVRRNNCIDTSACRSIEGVGIAENNWGQNIRVFPNPTNAQVTIDLADLTNIDVSLLTLAGQHLSTGFTNASGKIQLDLAHLSQGVYLVRLSNHGDVRFVRLVKQ